MWGVPGGPGCRGEGSSGGCGRRRGYAKTANVDAGRANECADEKADCGGVTYGVGAGESEEIACDELAGWGAGVASDDRIGSGIHYTVAPEDCGADDRCAE